MKRRRKAAKARAPAPRKTKATARPAAKKARRAVAKKATSAIDALIDPLLARGAELHGPCEETRLAEVEAAIGAPLPGDLRALYLRHDGQAWGGPVAARLMKLDEVLRTREVLADPDDPVGGVFLAIGLALFWEDEGSNHAGVFVKGPLAGMVAIHIHDDVDPSPRFASVASFLRALAAGPDHVELGDLAGDFPLAEDADRALVGEARVARAAIEGVGAGAPPELADVYAGIVRALAPAT